jgi:hypothetical protein
MHDACSMNVRDFDVLCFFGLMYSIRTKIQAVTIPIVIINKYHKMEREGLNYLSTPKH